MSKVRFEVKEMTIKIVPVFLLLVAAASNGETVNPNIENNTPASRYDIHNDGTVTDKVTGLMWQQCSLGQTRQSSDGTTSCEGSVTSYTWDDALSVSLTNSDYGFSDWRLPDLKELESLAALDRYSPSINTEVFPDTPGAAFWTSSPSTIFGFFSWFVGFSYGEVRTDYRNNGLHVRLVRNGS